MNYNKDLEDRIRDLEEKLEANDEENRTLRKQLDVESKLAYAFRWNLFIACNNAESDIETYRNTDIDEDIRNNDVIGSWRVANAILASISYEQRFGAPCCEASSDSMKVTQDYSDRSEKDIEQLEKLASLQLKLSNIVTELREAERGRKK